jgi:L-serine/L-threonine ammonia-lyase
MWVNGLREDTPFTTFRLKKKSRRLATTTTTTRTTTTAVGKAMQSVPAKRNLTATIATPTRRAVPSRPVACRCTVFYSTLSVLAFLLSLPSTTQGWSVARSSLPAVRSVGSNHHRFLSPHYRGGGGGGTATSSPSLAVSTTSTRFINNKFCMSTMTLASSSSSPVSEGARKLYRKTPLIPSEPLTKLVGRPVFLKLDALQASGSFKDRGMAHLCYTLQQKNISQNSGGSSTTTNFISSSGGNAGLAVTTVAARLDNVQVSVIVPETTKPLVVAKLQSLGADVTVTGKNWNAADAVARQRVADSNGTAEYVSPYDNPLLWTGHSTLVDETMEQLLLLQQHQETDYGSSTTTIGTLVVSVGGGGLLCGVLEGLERHGSTATVIAAETEGASSFGQSWKDGQGDPTHLVTLPAITSVATSLGALCVTPVAIERSLAYQGSVASSICTDAEAVEACLRFAQDHRILVEPACGAALAVAYSERLRQKYLMTKENDNNSNNRGPIVLEVCGGSGVTVDLLHAWKEQFHV